MSGRIRRSGGLKPVTVKFALGGTATADVDYTPGAVSNVFIPPGVREVWIELHPVADADDAEAMETITLTILAGTNYTLGAGTVASLTLANETAGGPPNPKSAARFLIQGAFGPDSAPSNGISPNVGQNILNSPCR